MKKIFIILLSFLSLACLAELKQDSTTFRYYSAPQSQGINQDEYHKLVWTCKDIIRQHSAYMAQFAGGGRSSYGVYGAQQKITEYLQRIATPTAVRLLSDLKQKNFNI